MAPEKTLRARPGENRASTPPIRGRSTLRGRVRRTAAGAAWLALAAAALAWSPGLCLADVELITLSPVRKLQLDGILLADELPSGTAVRVSRDRCLWAYSDIFTRNFRGRRQVHNLDVWGDPSEDLLNYRSGQPKPKVLLDLYDKRVTDLHFNLREDILWWTGELIYRLCFAYPIRSCRLNSLDGRNTGVGDWEWEKAGRAVRIYASRDGKKWHLVWQSQKGKGGPTQVQASVPRPALGSKTLYLKFWGQKNNVIHDLYLSGELAMPASDRQRLLASGKISVDCQPDPSALAIAVDGVPLHYGGEPAPAVRQASVRRSSDRLTVRVPGGNALSLVLHDGRLEGIGEIWVRGTKIAAAGRLGGLGRLSVKMAGPGRIDPPKSWQDYLHRRQQMSGKWPKCGGVPIEEVDLTGARVAAATASGNQAKIVLQPPDHRLASVHIRLQPALSDLPGAHDLRGFSCQFIFRPTGRWRPFSFRLNYYIPIVPGSFFVRQQWNRCEQTQLSYLTGLSDIPLYRRRYYAFRQPFFFLATRRGSFVECLRWSEAAVDKTHQELACLYRSISIPVRADGSASPLLFLIDRHPIRTLYEASDRYFALCDAMAERIGKEHFGVPWPIDPLPIAWDQYAWTGDALAAWRRGHRDVEGYLYRLARVMPQAARLGLGEILVSGVIESDAGHPREEYLPGSECFGSICAPWRLRVSPGMGGEAGLRELCRAAHAHGIKIIIWMTPAHYSNSSPVLRAHPDWIAWRADGTPETCGYRDITGVSLRTAAFDYAVGAYRRIRAATGIDGFWMDSYCTFGVLTDFARGHPLPQLDRTMALQRKLFEAGYRRLQIEACGPAGLSSGGHAGRAGIRELAQHPEGAYRFACPILAKPDYSLGVYFRCLANKCCPRFLPREVAQTLEQRNYRSDWPRIAAINRAYMRALPYMKRRHLLGERGVLWTDDGGHEVLWAYEELAWTAPAGGRAVELMEGGPPATGKFKAKPLRIYLIEH